MQSQQVIVRKAARALAKCGLVGPYGHCSIRLNASELLVCAAKPMGTIAIGEDGTIVPIHSTLMRRLHSEPPFMQVFSVAP